MDILRRRPLARIAKPASLILASVFCLTLPSCGFKTERRLAPKPPVPTLAAADPPPVQEEETLLAAEKERTRRLTDTARFFSGLAVDPSSEFYDLTKTNSWKCFARRMDNLWAFFAKSEPRMRAWAQTELTLVHDPSAPLFYPFGGPDIIFPELFFPCSSRAILIGLEPVGAVPMRWPLSLQKMDEMLSMDLISLEDILRLSFYRTRVLGSEVSSPMLKGVVPIMMISLARLGMDIEDVELGNLNENGDFIPEAEDSPSKKRAVEIRYRKAGDDLGKSLIYFSCDLSNAGLKKRPTLVDYLQRNAARCFTFLKSASYLCQDPQFSVIRKMVLLQSYAVLEDDSGLAYGAFDKNLWNISLYGKYEGPIEIFKYRYERDLYEAMKKSSRPLDFRIGYSHASCLLLAIKNPL